MPIVEDQRPSLKISFGAGGGGVFASGVPVLAGEAVEDLFGAVQPAGRRGPLALFQAENWLFGAATVPVGPGLEDTSHRLYGIILQATRGWHLARVWNYVPAVNESGPGGLENYRVFCRGRSLAFEEALGGGFKARLPAGSAVGTRSGDLTVAFAASRVPARQVENPLQMSAYEYPGDYGPRPPSFARATVVSERDHATVFISGTASIRGHSTISPHETRKQLDCTLENLTRISSACGLGPCLDQGGTSARHFKVYLRDEADLPLVASNLEERLLSKGDSVSFLHADLCRAALQVEIEASLFGVTRPLA